MGRKLTSEELASRFGPRFVLLEEWKGWEAYHWFYDTMLQKKIYALPKVIQYHPRKSGNIFPKRRHGCTHKPWYKSYEAMVRRALGKHPNRCYQNVDIFEEWLNDPRKFGEWAEANGYKPGLTIHRLDPSKGYFPENCCWVTLSENVRQSHKTTPRPKGKDGRFVKRDMPTN